MSRLACITLALLALPFAHQAAGASDELPLSNVEIHLRHTLCHGPCPAYTLTIHGNGVVEFDGWEHTAHRGRATWQIDKETVVDLINQFLFARRVAVRKGGMAKATIGPDGGLGVIQIQTYDGGGFILTLNLGKYTDTTYPNLYSNPELRDLPGVIEEAVGASRYIGSGE